MSQASLSFDAQTLQLAGHIDFDNVLELRRQGEALFSQEAAINTVDLAAVTKAGSAAVSLLISWLRYARRHQRDLRFVNLPEDLRGVARVSDVEELLLNDG